MYDFTAKIDRKATGSSKWLMMNKANPDIPDNIVPLSVADMELSTPPEILTGLQDFLHKASLGYSLPTDNYFTAVSNWMQRRHNWHIENDWILPSPGVIPALFNAVRAFTKKHDGVIVMTPVYYPFFNSIQKNNRQIIKTSLINKDNHYYIDFADFEKKAADHNNKVLLLCSPHNPVGRVWTKEELEKIADICLHHNVLVISDEIHSDIIMPDYKHHVFATINNQIADNCIICTAPSKTFNIAGLQVSNIIIKNPLLRKKFIKTARKAGYGILNSMGYKACELAYNECEQWLDEFLELIVYNKNFCEKFLQKYIPKIKVINLEGTYLQWWDCHALNMDKDELEKFMQQKAYIFADEGYIFGTEGDCFERINLACPTIVLEETLKRLHKALKNINQ
ncbi:MalY/PatB family protein [Pectinatus brassicae]|uniref:cysteine-S-conjugate beta-lyase n=1 Tax=Pectinatus brassicae TaxID=862415 RepID=A0A840UUT4_9FIRM|nr:MalY/PatB family protein [Pectinatus brassicae]MBB5336215.1 aminotransferase/cystathionine beta-lyase [Pectinatus brassicae]